MNPWAEAVDPVLFARRAGIEPDLWQAEVLLHDGRSLVLAGRQTGKTAVATVAVLHKAIYAPGSTSVVISASLRQASEAIARIRKLLNALGAGAPETTAEAALHIFLANGSRIIAVPNSEESVRGFTVDGALFLDEAARIGDAVIGAATPLLAAGGGRLIAVSTPAGYGGWFANEWHSDAPWRRWEVATSLCGRVTAEFLALERKSLPPAQFAQEYDLEFVADGGAVFAPSDIAAAFDFDNEDDDDDWTWHRGRGVTR